MTLGQIALTVVNHTVGSESTKTVPFGYNASKQAINSVTEINGTGTMMYEGDSDTAVTLGAAVDVSDDLTVQGYVKVKAPTYPRLSIVRRPPW